MAFIRIGCFEDFKSADTLLIDVDRDGLHAFIAWLRDAIESGQRKTISDCPGAIVQAGLHIELLRSRDDIGILRTAEGAFVWQRSEDGWADIVELLDAMKSGAGHQYLDGPRDEIQGWRASENTALSGGTVWKRSRAANRLVLNHLSGCRR